MRKTIILLLIAASWAGSAWAQTAPTYTISTIAGNGTAGFAGDSGAATSAQIFLPFTAVLGGGNLYISDQVNNRIRYVVGTTITTLVGTGTSGYDGDGKEATKALIFNPTGLVVDGSGNVFFSDTRNQVVRKVTSSGTISTYAGDNALGAGLSGDNGAATVAQLNSPAGLALDAGGNLYIADSFNNRIRKVTPATATIPGTITAFAGNLFADFAGDGGPALQAELHNPEAIAFDSIGNLYIADTLNNRIRVVTLDGNIHTVAGNGTAGFKGDGGQAVNASLDHPEGIAVDTAGNLYIADTFNQRIRMVLTNGKIVTIAGTGGQAYTGDGGPSTSASLNFPASVFVDAQGNLYVTDSQNYAIRKMVPSAAPVSPGVPSIRSTNGVQSASGFGGFPTVAQGSWIEIFGSNLAADTRLWLASDFNGINAPTTLDRTTVTIGGQPAYVEYVSAVQVNALIPTNVPIGTQPVVVGNSAGSSAAYNVTVAASQPGLFAPPQFVVAGKQYAGALALDGKTYIAPTGSIAGITSAPAHPGDIITFYGIGFGTTNPVIPSGQITQSLNSLTGTFSIKIGGADASVNCGQCYAGLAPGSVGLYQFNVQVPTIATTDLAPVTFTLTDASGVHNSTQTLFIAVKN